jgi:hypothetical protein
LQRAGIVNDTGTAAIADNLSKAGWSLGWVSAVDPHGQAIFVVDAHRDDGRRFVVRADEKLTAFLELEGGLYPPIERTMLTIIAAMAASVSLCTRMNC